MSGTITYTLNEQDVVVAQRAQYGRRASSRRSLGHKTLALAILWLGGFAINLLEDATWADAARSASIFCAAIVVPLLLLMFMGYGLAGYQARRLFRQQRTLREEYRTSWTDEGLDLRSAAVTAVMAWSDFHSWGQETSGYLIYLSDYNCYVLPRRCFTDTQWTDLEETLVRSGLPRRGAKVAASRVRPSQADAEKARIRRWGIAAWSNPGRVALLWVILAFLTIIDTIIFPNRGGAVSGILFLSGAPVLAALLAGWVLRLRSATLGLAAIFLAIAIVFQGEWLLSKFVVPQGQEDGFFAPLAGAMTLVAILPVWLRFSHSNAKRAGAATGLLIATIAIAAWFSQADLTFYRASAQARSLLGFGPSEQENATDESIAAMRDIPVDRLWGAQPGLVEKAVEGLSPRIPGRSNVYAIAVAGDGQQQLFSREAHLALRVAATRYGGEYRGGVLLSNGVADVLHAPFATQDNMAAAARGLGRRIDPVRDIAFVYLASHGSQDAELATVLPTYDDLTPISAASVADALARAGIRRRIIIVSACFSGSWIPALANDDTIVITAARKDRSSFGCDDRRSVTYFGEAFLKGPLAQSVSLRDAFEAARRTILGWEAGDHLTPSEPQVFVGRNMQALWTQAGSARR
ncbi:C13 family peptidase [Sphingomonas sp.]|uniref:C13 family peptidase n=1 Tax=Sphingomonas sp. TaxID=28214 RepID=UPI003D6D5F08